MAVPTLLYGSECWTMGKRDTKKLQAAEMRFLKSVKGRTRLDKIRNEDIKKELGVFSINDTMRIYRQDWLEHVERMFFRFAGGKVLNEDNLSKPHGSLFKMLLN
jgi:hypothetical protein